MLTNKAPPARHSCCAATHFATHGIGHIERLMIPGTPAVQSISTEIRPTNTRVATRSRCKITVKNTSDESAQTQGPGAGYTYVQGQTYFTQQFASDLGKWRVGIGPRAWIAPSSRSAGDSAESWRLAKPG